MPQSYSVISGAAWIGLNSVANPGAQQWRWAGGQNYDPTVQARLRWPACRSSVAAFLAFSAAVEDAEPRDVALGRSEWAAVSAGFETHKSSRAAVHRR